MRATRQNLRASLKKVFSTESQFNMVGIDSPNLTADATFQHNAQDAELYMAVRPHTLWSPAHGIVFRNDSSSRRTQHAWQPHYGIKFTPNSPQRASYASFAPIATQNARKRTSASDTEYLMQDIESEPTPVTDEEWSDSLEDKIAELQTKEDTRTAGLVSQKKIGTQDPPNTHFARVTSLRASRRTPRKAKAPSVAKPTLVAKAPLVGTAEEANRVKRSWGGKRIVFDEEPEIKRRLEKITREGEVLDEELSRVGLDSLKDFQGQLTEVTDEYKTFLALTNSSLGASMQTLRLMGQVFRDFERKGEVIFKWLDEKEREGTAAGLHQPCSTTSIHGPKIKGNEGLEYVPIEPLEVELRQLLTTYHLLAPFWENHLRRKWKNNMKIKALAHEVRFWRRHGRYREKRYNEAQSDSEPSDYWDMYRRMEIAAKCNGYTVFVYGEVYREIKNIRYWPLSNPSNVSANETRFAGKGESIVSGQKWNDLLHKVQWHSKGLFYQGSSRKNIYTHMESVLYVYDIITRGSLVEQRAFIAYWAFFLRRFIASPLALLVRRLNYRRDGHYSSYIYDFQKKFSLHISQSRSAEASANVWKILFNYCTRMENSLLDSDVELIRTRLRDIYRAARTITKVQDETRIANSITLQSKNISRNSILFLKLERKLERKILAASELTIPVTRKMSEGSWPDMDLEFPVERPMSSQESRKRFLRPSYRRKPPPAKVSFKSKRKKEETVREPPPASGKLLAKELPATPPPHPGSGGEATPRRRISRSRAMAAKNSSANKKRLYSTLYYGPFENYMVKASLQLSDYENGSVISSEATQDLNHAPIVKADANNRLSSMNASTLSEASGRELQPCRPIFSDRVSNRKIYEISDSLPDTCWFSKYSHTSCEKENVTFDGETSEHTYMMNADNLELRVRSYSIDDTSTQTDNDVVSSSERNSENNDDSGLIIDPKFCISPQKLREAMLASPNSDAAYWTYELYRGPENEKVLVHYCRNKKSSEIAAQHFLEEKFVGLDIEWKPQATAADGIKKNTALIQMASERRVALFHIALFKGQTVEELVPPTLKKILESADIIKVGVSILADTTRIRKYLDIESQALVELSHFYKILKYSLDHHDMLNKRLVSVAKQVEEFLQLPLSKGPVRESDWSSELGVQQVRYAASDAYANLRLLFLYELKRKSMEPMPPFPDFAELKLPLPAIFRVAKDASEDSSSSLSTAESSDDTDEDAIDYGVERGEITETGSPVLGGIQPDEFESSLPHDHNEVRPEEQGFVPDTTQHESPKIEYPKLPLDRDEC